MPGRVVAIVGRPNVGKSAIFNRLAGRRIAIVHEQSGVTRDRLMREIEWDEQRFELIDTGGIGNPAGKRSRDAIEAGIHSQVEAALQDAAAAIFVTDIEAGLVPLDEEVARLLRSGGSRIFLAVNKADAPGRDGDAVEFERLGFPVFPVSALHNRGFDELMSRVLAVLPDVENETELKPLRVAVVGRPNVGKSSYINRLLRSERVIVSDVPGTTRDSIDIPFAVGQGSQARHYVLADTAGIRRSGKIDSAVERFGRLRAEKSIRQADVVVLVLDALQGPTAQDKKIAALIGRHRKGALLLVNKWDLAGAVTQRQYGPALRNAMPFMGHCPVVFVSAKSGYNIRRSVEAIDLVAAQIRTGLPTGLLNRALLDAAKRVGPPSAGGKALKLFYATQVGVEPPRVRIFVNHPRRVSPAYEQYLVGSLRAAFGLEGAPLVLEFRARRR